MARASIRMALFATLVAGTVAGCGERHETSGMNDGVKTNSYRLYGTNTSTDMRLGLDRYRGAEANYFRNSDSFRHDVNRDNGMTGYSADGFNRLHGNVQPNTGTAMNGTQTPNPSAGGMHNNTRMEAAQDIASRLTTLDPVQSCNVMLTDNNAYVAVDTKDGQNLDNAADVKTQIANQVKAMRPNIQNVYVSADPDFRGRMKGYADNLQAGKPVSGFVNEFNTMAQRLFPTNAANGTVPAAPPVTPAQ